MNPTNKKRELRLDKYLADMGIGSRSQVKMMIRKKQIQVNGATETHADQKICPDTDEVMVNKEPVSYAHMEYYMLNKPSGVVSATTDRFEKTVVDLITTRQRKDLFPVGRLDKDTEGLLLITNDGELAHQLLSPKKHVAKTYFARISGDINASIIDAFAAGIDIGDEKPTLPAKLIVLTSAAVTEVHVTICEGRFHQIKRMFQAVGCSVFFLKRLTMGTLILDDDLAPGEYRNLTTEEIERLRNNNAKE